MKKYIFGKQYFGHIPCMLRKTTLMNSSIVDETVHPDSESLELVKKIYGI